MTPPNSKTRKPLFCRLPDGTHRILDELVERTGYSKKEIIVIALERLRNSMKRKSDKHFGEDME